MYRSAWCGWRARAFARPRVGFATQRWPRSCWRSRLAALRNGRAREGRARPHGAAGLRRGKCPPGACAQRTAAPLSALRKVAAARAENVPTEELKARSWFWLPMLSNGTKIADICGNAFEPCWRPEWKDSRSAILRNRPATRNLTVMRDGNRYWVVIENLSVSGRQFRPRFSWELRPGIASPAGLVYWGLAGAYRERASPATTQKTDGTTLDPHGPGQTGRIWSCARGEAIVPAAPREVELDDPQLSDHDRPLAPRGHRRPS